jgi:Tol biopolymer transport system component
MGTVHIVSPVGGPVRRVSDFPARLQLSWSPDGRWLAASKARVGNDAPGGIHLISVATGEHRQVTFPKSPAFDVSPSFSPDARTLAFASCEGVEDWPVCDVHVLPIDSGLRPQGPARTLTRQRLVNLGVAWTRDGRSVVYASQRGLWRVRADGGAPPERLELAGDAATPSTVGSRDRIAFNRRSGLPDIYQLETGGSSKPLIQSTFNERAPQYSPDDRRIVFESERSDLAREVWLADADGSNVTRLTRGPGRHQGSPSWSPDGRVIAFDSQGEDGRRDIWAVGANGTGLRQITRNAADDYIPTWSRDGRFIYFGTNRTGRDEKWRVKVADQTEEPVAARLFESADGLMLYHEREGVLLARPASGGHERTIRSCRGAWAVGPRGVFYECAADRTGRTTQRTVSHWDADTGKSQAIATLTDTDAIGGMSVSRDGRRIIYDRSKATFDLMMIENFH